MGNLCIKSYFLLNNIECSLCQENLNRSAYWSCGCGNKYHIDCMRNGDCINCNYNYNNNNNKNKLFISPYH
jgi:hypothetical protein